MGKNRSADLEVKLIQGLQQEDLVAVEDAVSQAASLDPGTCFAVDTALAARLRDPRLGGRPIAGLSLSLLTDLFDRCVTRLNRATESSTSPSDVGQHAWELLDVVRRTELLQRIAAESLENQWADRILELVDLSQFTFPRLFTQRCETYGQRTLLLNPQNGRTASHSFSSVRGRIDLITKGLCALLEDGRDKRVAILSPNRLDAALVDLACLSSGIVNVMVPATASADDVAYILNHSSIDLVVVAGDRGLKHVLAAVDSLPTPPIIVALDRRSPPGTSVVSYEELLDRGARLSDDQLQGRRDRVKINDLASIMYTSGTTGTPKGICFSYRNIVFKRFARALAIPRISDQDRFLAYLPLYHTFGRYLELTGCLFWGATYCFAEDPSIKTLTRQMQNLKASVFISIPRKWIQLHEMITSRVDVDTASDEAIREQVDAATGGNLRWGLSAAGYLDPEIFHFFNRNDVFLMSGFGMTEATGGITMTPPGAYVDNSLGQPLPGIEVKLAEDGEMKIRGPYVMTGYLDPPDGKPSFDEEGWFGTGDIMEHNSVGQFQIVDRKKEIYKNVKGETIAPQKIENLFRDFDSISRIFVVGDHREYNTALIYPNPNYESLDFANMPAEEVKEHFRSLVVTANTFLEPFERIVDFAVLDRDFDADQGELTAKGTYRRSPIERNFADRIRLLYRRTKKIVGGVEVVVPNWLFQALGITTYDLSVRDNLLLLNSAGRQLQIRLVDENRVQVGPCLYTTSGPNVDLGLLLSSPRLWLGNDELVAFAPLTDRHRSRQRRPHDELSWEERLEPSQPDHNIISLVAQVETASEITLDHLYACALTTHAPDLDVALAGLEALKYVATETEGSVTELARHLLRRLSRSKDPRVLCHALKILIAVEVPAQYRNTLRTFFNSPGCSQAGDTIGDLLAETIPADRFESIVEETATLCRTATKSTPTEDVAQRLLTVLVGYCADHPSQYRRSRAFLTRMGVEAGTEMLRNHAVFSEQSLTEEFRDWLGRPARVAVDPETGREYRWEDVIEFADDVEAPMQRRILDTIQSTQLLSEGAFLFANGKSLHLSDIPPGGIWIRRLGKAHGKTVYRIAVRTRFREQIDLAVNLGTELNQDLMDDETRWLIIASELREDTPIVEDFGGYWRERGLWSEEYIPGEPVDRAFRAASRRDKGYDYLALLWPSTAWSAASAYVKFWNRTGRQLAIVDATPSNVIVPMHDYQIGARLVSIAKREPCQMLSRLLLGLRKELVETIESEHPPLEGLVSWRVLFAAVLEAVGEAEGLPLLRTLHEEGLNGLSQAARTELTSFLSEVEKRGFVPRRLHCAIQRFRRWLFLNRDATLSARAATLNEIKATYDLTRFYSDRPETRVRFFTDTVLHEAPSDLAEGLESIIQRLRTHDLDAEEMPHTISDLRARLRPDPELDYFLTRLTYPYLRPEDEAQFVARDVGAALQSEMVVCFEDQFGDTHLVRHALTAKEIGRLHDLFLAAKLNVQFRPEHRFLIALSERATVIGGLFYEVDPEEQNAHMDKIVVDPRFQGRGVARSLMDELCHRLATEGFRTLTTGFFRPQFFYRFGFAVERRYAGLMRTLDPVEEVGAQPSLIV